MHLYLCILQRKLTQCFHVLDAVHTLTCALMLLNTDLHGQVGIIMLECVSVKLEVCSKCVGAHMINKERELFKSCVLLRGPLD